MTTGTQTLYEQCEALFVDYPLAVRQPWSTSAVMALVQPGTDPLQFYVLSLYFDNDPYPSCLLRPWRSTDSVVIRADGSASDAARAADILASTVPLPRHGAMFGYVVGEKVTALMPFYSEPGDEVHQQPSWAIMPRVGEHRDLWPVFTGEPLFWFWQQYHEGRIIDLASVIAASPGAAHWVSTFEALGADCCTVTRDLETGDATLPAGVYAYYGLLRDDVPVPPMDVLLAAYDVIDLAPRFKEMAR